MFEPDQLEGTDLNNWILKRKAWAIIDSLLETEGIVRRYIDKAGILIVKRGGAIIYGDTTAKELLGEDLKGVDLVDVPDKMVFTKVDGGELSVSEYPASRALAGEEVDFLVLGYKDKQLLVSATPVHRGANVAAAVVWFKEIV